MIHSLSKGNTSCRCFGKILSPPTWYYCILTNDTDPSQYVRCSTTFKHETIIFAHIAIVYPKLPKCAMHRVSLVNFKILRNRVLLDVVSLEYFSIDYNLQDLYALVHCIHFQKD